LKKIACTSVPTFGALGFGERWDDSSQWEMRKIGKGPYERRGGQVHHGKGQNGREREYYGKKKKKKSERKGRMPQKYILDRTERKGGRKTFFLQRSLNRGRNK